MTLKYAALARVSSREQEREGFSLDVQEDALQRYAERQGGRIVRLYRIAESASKREERSVFRELLAYARDHAGELNGVLFYKVDRAARNLFDYVELERLEAEHGIPVIYVAQPTENTPAGRMQRRILANMASFYTEQQSLDVREGMARRAENGLFVGHAPYGYRNLRVDGRGLIETHPEHAHKVRRIFELYARDGHTIDSLVDALEAEGVFYNGNRARFVRSKLHDMLRDRAYLGEVFHQGQWYPGKHEPLVDAVTWERVQERLGNRTYRSLDLTYAGGIVTCSYCGHPITGELKQKDTRAGTRSYVYYRCTQYTTAGHPRSRLREEAMDAQVLSLFDRMRIPSDSVREWFLEVLKAKCRESCNTKRDQAGRVEAELKGLRRQIDRLLDLRLAEEIDGATFKRKHAELKRRVDGLNAKRQPTGNSGNGAVVVKTFELSQSLRQRWVTADISGKRRLLDAVCLNWRLDGASLIPTIRKPFDVLAKGVILKDGRGDWI